MHRDRVAVTDRIRLQPQGVSVGQTPECPIHTRVFHLMLCASSWSREQSCFALALEPIAFAIDADDSRVVKDAVEHRRGEHAVAGEGAIPTSEGEIRSEY
jgi:hypothetical protein